jgi:glycosyltransferase involved in cell wall biosynthesis
MPNKKICVLTSVHPAFDTRIFHKECKTLANAGYNVTLIAQHEKNETIDGIKVIALPKPHNRIQRMAFLSCRILILALREKADIYHFHDPELLPVGVWLKLFTKAKVIYDVHEDYGKQILSKQYLPKLTIRFVGLFVSILEKLISRMFDGVVTATDDIANNFAGHKIAVAVKNFPILSNFTEIKKYNKDDNASFNLIYAGGLTEIRGVTQIVQSLEYINPEKQVTLTLYGNFYPPIYEKQIRSLKGFEKVEYLGWIESREIPEKMAQADVGIVCLHPITNYLAALPIKLFEYMAAGLPVIASNFPLWKEIVEDNNCGICVDPLNPKEIAKAVKYLMEHPELRKKMGQNGRRAVEEKYNWEKEAEKLLKVYRKL